MTVKLRTKADEAQDDPEPSEDRQKAAEAALERVSEDADVPAAVEMHEDRTKEMRTPGFSRMRTDWHGPDAQIVASVLKVAEDRIMTTFVDAYQVMNDLYLLIREPEVTEHGEVVLDRYGFPVWAKDEDGRYYEDWSQLGIKDRDTFLFQITTRLVEWEQRAADAWGEAMLAKAQWEERFAITFQETGDAKRKTDEGLTQHARAASREERYFAIFQSLFSRRADALVRSMTLLGQRLKDSMP